MLCIAVELICNGHNRHPTRQAEPKRLAASLVGRELWKTKRDIIEESDRRQREEAEHERRMMWKFRSRCTGRTLTATSGLAVHAPDSLEALYGSTCVCVCVCVCCGSFTFASCCECVRQQTHCKNTAQLPQHGRTEPRAQVAAL